MNTHASSQYNLPWSISWLSGTRGETHKNTWIEKSENHELSYILNMRTWLGRPQSFLHVGLKIESNLIFSWHIEIRC